MANKMTPAESKICNLQKQMGWDCKSAKLLAGDVKLIFSNAVDAKAAFTLLSKQHTTELSSSRYGESTSVWLIEV